VQPRDRLLPRIAPLGEADGAFGQAGLGRQDTIVDLLAPRGRAGADPEQLELVGGDGRIQPRVERLGGRLAVGGRRDSLAAEDDVARVLLGLDLDLRREAPPHELGADALAQLRFREQEEVVVAAPEDDERRDHARLRRQQQRLAGLARAEGNDVVRDHPVEELLGCWAGDAHVRARPECDSGHPVYCRDGVPVQGGEEGAGGGLRPRPAAAGAIPDGEVACPARGFDPID
jgi:hypothetical protein